MSSTPESPADSNPPALTFAEGKGDDNLWSAGVVAAIIAAIVLVAAGVTAAVALSHKTSTNEPPKPALPDITQPSAAAAPHAGVIRVELMSSPVVLASGQMLMAAGESIDLGNGVSLEVPDGWKTVGEDEGFAQVVNPDYPASFAVWSGVVDGTDVEAQLNTDVNALVENNGLTNVKTTKVEAGNIKAEKQKFFDVIASQQFAAEMTTQQGTKSKVGELVELMNTGENSKIKTPAGFSVFIVMDSPDKEAYATALPDLIKMLEAVLGDTSAA